MDDFSISNIERLLEDIECNLSVNVIDISTYVGMIYAHILNPQNTAEQDFKTCKEINAKLYIWQKQLDSQKRKASKNTDNTTASKTKKNSYKKEGHGN